MKPLIHDNFLLQNKIAERLYHEVAAVLPVIDYHNHLDPKLLAEDTNFQNITQLWIQPDPYKHRAMRISGIPEKEITGNATDEQKFLNWASTVPKTVGNPLFHWTCLELKRVFDIDEVLSEKNASSVWEICNERIKAHSSIALLKKMQVQQLCTSDDLLADLNIHQKASQQHGIDVLPSLRADATIEGKRTGYKLWLQQLSQQTNVIIEDLSSYRAAIDIKLDHFREAGCLLADHALDAGFRFERPTLETATALFQKQLLGILLTSKEDRLLTTYWLVELGKMYAERGWTLQLHIGAQRHTSSRLRRLAGASGGYAAIGNATDIASIAHFLDTLERENALPNTILYNLNPIDNAAFASLTGSFAQDCVAGKIQFGPAWWYNDHYQGVQEHLNTLSSYGLLHHFIGMTTDSRSVLSFYRHEYFRRILCNFIGQQVAIEHLPNDWELLQTLVQAVCYDNAKHWFTKKKNEYVTTTVKG